MALAHPSQLQYAILRRVTPILLAIALALTMMAVQAPATVDGRASGGNEAQRVVKYAKSHLGKRFRLGAEGMRYFDCSGLVYRVFQQAGLIKRIGGSRRLARGYYKWFRDRGLASRNNPRVGDIIVWTEKGRISHTGIYIGGGRALSALTSGVRTHRIHTISVKFKAYLHVRLSR